MSLELNGALGEDGVEHKSGRRLRRGGTGFGFAKGNVAVLLVGEIILEHRMVHNGLAVEDDRDAA